ncbi:MAG: glycosyltransferase family 2 protein [Candidatus Omnitrophota bacterium]
MDEILNLCPEKVYSVMVVDEISLIVPVYNEQELIQETVEIFLTDLSNICKNYELIIVDDASTDETAEILKNLKSKYQHRLIVITNEKNIGGGRSLIKGFHAARYSLVATNFADRPFNLLELKNILPKFLKNIDFIVVVRKNRSANSVYRKITSLINYYLIRLLFNIKVKDFQFVQIYKREILQSISVDSHRTFVPPEIIIRLLLNNYIMDEYEADFYPRTKGMAKCGNPRIILRAIYDMFSFWVNLNLLKKYRD